MFELASIDYRHLYIKKIISIYQHISMLRKLLLGNLKKIGRLHFTKDFYIDYRISIIGYRISIIEHQNSEDNIFSCKHLEYRST